MGAMLMNMAANMLGLGNAATPLGLRAMSLLDRLNPHPGVASNAMCTFLAINTASIQLIPTTAIGILAIYGSKNAAAIVPAAVLATFIAACSGVLSAKLFERLPMFRLAPAQPSTRADASDAAPVEVVEVEQVQTRPLSALKICVLVVFIAAFGLMFILLAFPEWLSAFGELPPRPAEMEGKGAVIRALFAIAILAVPFLLSFFPLYAALRGVKVYEQFVEGAKEAFAVGMRIVPFLVAMLVAIGLLRDAGVVTLVTRKLTPLLATIHFPADLLPLVLMRPLSGSGTQGIFIDLVKTFGPDALVSRMAATIYGSTETTFYVIAVYFGSVAVRQTRHAIAAGLVADTVAVIASVTICHLLFG
jgi:spore maturation protein SpmB